eukprot:TRINITY_DN3486_c5_g1_i1.p1 TRINITY_DN3486_c5_g1~~TRINITY_DN3486_c5_g1_i1.p1  ORF type:complete len:850 (+),score=228.64 TRINITY_DN3486_c5_g1_i1:58-2607(+)
MDYREEYRKLCVDHNVKVNSLVSSLPAGGDKLEVLDLTNTLVGANGVKPVIGLVQKCTDLHTLNLHGQRLTSEAAQEVVNALQAHPSLTALDLSDNHCPLAGPSILELVKKNTKLITLNITDCAVRPMFQKLIDLQLAKNDGKEYNAGEAKTAKEADTVQQAAVSTGATAHVVTPPTNDPFAADDDDDDNDGFGSFDKQDTGQKKPDLLRPGSSTRRDKRRPTVCSEVWQDKEIDEFQAPIVSKPEEASKWLCERLEHVHLFSHLDDRELKMAVGAMEETKFKVGDNIRTQGEEGGDRYYVIYSGECDSIVDETVQAMKKGDHFGEVQLLYHQDETATIRVTSSELVAYSIEREIYRRILAKASKMKRKTYGGFLQNVKFLEGMTRTELLQLADALKAVRVKNGEQIISYGEEGQWFHLIIEGTVEVIGRDANGKNIKVCEFTEGDCVGELEFINNHKCVADVLAVGEVRTAKMNRKHFEMSMGPVVDVLKRTAESSNVYEYYRLTQEEMSKPTEVPTEETPEEEEGESEFGGFGANPFNNDDAPKPTRGRRQTVSAEVITEEDVESFQPNVVPKSNESKEFIATALERIPLFCHLEAFELQQLAMAMEEMKFEKDEVIIENGHEGDMFYLVANGEVQGITTDEEAVEYKSGQHFGEVVLMYSQPHQMTYKSASHDVVTYTLDRNTYKHIMQKASMKKRAMYGDFLKKVGFLKTCSDAELLQLADALKPSAYRDGEHLISFEDAGTWFYIIVEGKVEVWGRDSEMKEKLVCEFVEGDCVGELEFINNHKCVADVKAKDDVRTAKMHRHHFEMCMGPIVDILKRQADTGEVYEYYRQTLAGNNAPVTATD